MEKCSSWDGARDNGPITTQVHAVRFLVRATQWREAWLLAHIDNDHVGYQSGSRPAGGRGGGSKTNGENLHILYVWAIDAGGGEIVA